MANHYFSEQPETKSERKTIKEVIRGKSYHFHVDRGVFSKGGLDFGSRLLIEAFELPLVEGPLADVGCGWGPIGLTVASTHPNTQIYMVDINERSVQLAKENATLNRVPNVTVKQNNLLDGFGDHFFSAVLTNPPIRAGKDVIFSIYEQAKRMLKINGDIWVVIQKKQGAASTLKKLEELGFEVKLEVKSKGYFVFRGKNN
ncbi:methyltransferase [Salipaludibacillus sp. LMS25]|jgi:16S rRNA (guanine1207-N2)-methyltransferase|uniref:class I SAM-dependent methyltransferase n=1 Tax=Salipaludibacillus sp. LMS25 TaxID=2924031 RepID=UPI0020D060B4|nr:methyltransferase [Salipaludibacillus sp. LMS25]UTR16706.1 methyltransferase [Salipaludibacillus sp. LMS25]